MAKTYLDIVKYMIEAKFSIEGLVDKPDIIGAVFGQTEGLLGDELDLRELQKNGKIGRIEIEVFPSGNRTNGKLYLPASLDRIETCILAAATEAVDRVGPYEAKFVVEKVEDTRSEKRRKILTRAKELVKMLTTMGMPDSKELAELVQSDVRTSEMVTYGPEHLPAGPDVGKSNEIIIVEGRADVLTLLRNDITNVIAVGGATSNIPKSLITLANEKESTIFVDGDRGGDMILRTLTNVAEIDYVTKAPDGKEVEDLTRKEIIKALRTKIPIEQYLIESKQKRKFQEQGGLRPQFSQQPPLPPKPQQSQTSSGSVKIDEQKIPNAPAPTAQARPNIDIREEQQMDEPDDEKPSVKDLRSDAIDEDDSTLPKIEPQRYKKDAAPQQKPALESVVYSTLSNGLEELSGSLRSRLYDSVGNVIKEVPIRELLSSIQDTENLYAVVLDGVITQRLVELALHKGTKAIYGIRANPMSKRHTDIMLYTKEQGVIE